MPVTSRARRLQAEQRILDTYFPGFRIQDPDSATAGAIGRLRTNAGKEYTLWIPLQGFPNEPPPAYVIAPALKGFDGKPFGRRGPSPNLHLLQPDDHANARVCHHAPWTWTSRFTIYHVVLKVRIWLEAYEGHLRDGSPLDRWLHHTG